MICFAMKRTLSHANWEFDRFEALAESKMLEYNLKKSSIVILGKGKARTALEEKFLENPPLLYGKPLSIKSQGTYLGEEIGGSLSNCITLTVNKRIGLVKKSIFEIKHVIEDCRSKVAGSIQTGLLLWESCLASYLFNNASTWMDISRKDVNRLIKIQNLFLNMLLGVYKCPSVMMYWDLKMLTVPMRLLKMKLNLYHHIECQDKKAISFQMMQIQKKLKLPSLHWEVLPFLNKHQILDVKIYPKAQWKHLVNDLIHLENRQTLIDWSKNYKKVDSLSLELEEYKVKGYFSQMNLADSRLKLLRLSAGLNPKHAE